MREAALKEQAAGADPADTPMVDEDVKPCVGELQVAQPDVATHAHPPPPPLPVVASAVSLAPVVIS